MPGERVVPPVAQQPRRLRRHLPLVLRQLPPSGHLLAHAVDRVRVLILLAGRIYFRRGLIERQVALPAPLALGLGNRRDEGHLAPPFEDAVRRAAILKLPMPPRALVRRVEDRLLEEAGQGSRPALGWAAW